MIRSVLGGMVLLAAGAVLLGSRPGERPDGLPDPQTTLGIDPVRVAIDPGHGGRDPGAEREGVREADLMLLLARDLAAAIDAAPGLTSLLLRSEDRFLRLEDRTGSARDGNADLFLSLHADSLKTDAASGASVYVLSATASDAATRLMVERHDRADIVPGADLAGEDDTLVETILDLARSRTDPRSEALQAALIDGMEAAGVPLNSNPAREAMLAVLMGPDLPSVLIETGFLSNPADLARLRSEQGRAELVEGIVAGLLAYLERR